MSYYVSQSEPYPQTVGTILKYERERRRIPLEKVAQDLNIKIDYLEKIEDDSFGELPADIYTKNYIRRFAELVKVDAPAMLRLYEKQRHVYEITRQGSAEVFSKKKKRSFSFILTPKIVRRLSIGLILFAFIFYLWYQVSDLSSAPEIIILEPHENEITIKDDFIQVVGSTSQDATLTINSKQIKLTSEGTFQETIELQRGSNNLQFKAENKFGKKTEVEKKVFVE